MSAPEPHPSLLLVDDDDVFRRRMAQALRDRGYDVREAAVVDQALASARGDSPEYAVVDLRMPGRSGMDLVKELHEIDPGTRVLLLTGYGSIASAVEAMKRGAVSYLPKPADADDILAAFARAENPAAAPARSGSAAPSLARTEWEHINRVLGDCGGNISEAARRLGIHRRSLQRKLGKHPPRE